MLDTLSMEFMTIFAILLTSLQAENLLVQQQRVNSNSTRKWILKNDCYLLLSMWQPPVLPNFWPSQNGCNFSWSSIWEYKTKISTTVMLILQHFLVTFKFSFILKASLFSMETAVGDKCLQKEHLNCCKSLEYLYLLSIKCKGGSSA